MSKRCIVLGGSGVVGSAICRALNEEDAHVAFTYNSNEPRATALALELKSPVFLRCDLGNFEVTRKTIHHAAEALGGLDALIVAAGTSGDERFWKCASASNYDKLQQIDANAFDEMMSVNARGALAACQAASSWMQHNGGNILLIRSIDGIKPVPSPVHFAASTAAVKGMVEAMSKELGNYNIRVNIIALGILDGGASHKLSSEVKEAYLKHSSMKRFGRPEEAASIAAWVALENTYITGQVLIVDGGL